MNKNNIVSGLGNVNIIYNSDYIKEKLEEKLREFDLSEDQILLKNLQELNLSLSEIDRIINDPRNLGEINYTYTVTPFLYERKRMILERIKHIEVSRKIENIQQIVEQLSEKEKRPIFHIFLICYHKEKLNTIKKYKISL